MQMRESFLKALPPQTRQRIVDAELACRAGGQAKHLSFSSITQLAKDVQATTNQPKTIMWSSTAPDMSIPITQLQEIATTPPQKSKSYANRRNQKITCHFCGKLGHGIRECWRAAGLCLICGQKHKIEECPRYDPTRRTPAKDEPALNC